MGHVSSGIIFEEVVSLILYSANIICGLTYAPTLIMLEVVPPGAPTEESAGPALPALAMYMTLCLLTSSFAKSEKDPKLGDFDGSPYDIFTISHLLRITAINPRISPVPVSMEPKRVSPIRIPTI